MVHDSPEVELLWHTISLNYTFRMGQFIQNLSTGHSKRLLSTNNYSLTDGGKG